MNGLGSDTQRLFLLDSSIDPEEYDRPALNQHDDSDSQIENE